MKIVSHLEDSRPNIKSADNENYTSEDNISLRR